jgi:exosome complex RNA-binding protein Rrp4
MITLDFRDPARAAGVHLEPLEYTPSPTDVMIAKIAKACLEEHLADLNERDAAQAKVLSKT